MKDGEPELSANLLKQSKTLLFLPKLPMSGFFQILLHMKTQLL